VAILVKPTEAAMTVKMTREAEKEEEEETAIAKSIILARPVRIVRLVIEGEVIDETKIHRLLIKRSHIDPITMQKTVSIEENPIAIQKAEKIDRKVNGHMGLTLTAEKIAVMWMNDRTETVEQAPRNQPAQIV
jgi:hypothetical protein